MEHARPHASSVPGPDSASIAGFLEWDHDRLDGLLDDTRRLLGSGRPEDAAARCTEFRDGLLRHIRMEEEILFPAFELATGMSHGGPTAQMRLEHTEIRACLDRMRDLFAAAGGRVAPGAAPLPPAFEDLRAALIGVLVDHNVKEERVLYPMTDQLLPAQEKESLLRRMRSL
jgi:iron-sulfur cluster repair protein YtfE (RIC family)